MARYVNVEGTTWPVDVGEVEWSLRYSCPDDVKLVAASVVAAYGHLTDPGISERAAVAALRRARKAAAS